MIKSKQDTFFLDAHPQVPVGDVAVVHVVVSVEGGVSAVDLEHAAVVDPARVVQLVEDVARLIFDEDGGGGRAEHAHVQLLREHMHNQCVQRLHAAQLVAEVNTSCLIAKLQEQNA